VEAFWVLDAVLATLLPRGYHSAAGIAGVIADQVRHPLLGLAY